MALSRRLLSGTKILTLDTGVQQRLEFFKDYENKKVDIYSQLIEDWNPDTQSLDIVVTDLNTSTATTTAITTSTRLTDTWGGKYVQLGFTDGVYQVEVKIKIGTTSIISQKGCLFVDCTMKCNIAKFDTKMLLLHYALTHIEGCRCDCSDMANVYTGLLRMIDEKGFCPCKSI